MNIILHALGIVGMLSFLYGSISFPSVVSIVLLMSGTFMVINSLTGLYVLSHTEDEEDDEYEE